MGLFTKIEFADDSASGWWGCEHVHEGCDHCWAEVDSKRYGHKVWGRNVPRREILSWRETIIKAQKLAVSDGRKRRVFYGDMMDTFEKPMPLVRGIGEKQVIMPYNTGDLRTEFFTKYIPMCPDLIFQLFTKRPSNINKYIPDDWKTKPPKNVYFGASVVNQATANTLIPQLLKVEGNKFLSVEPMLDAIDLKPWLSELDWIIVGGESGHHRRPFNADWARQIRDDCKEAGVAFFMKQIDKILPIPEDLKIREFHDDGPPFDWNENSKTPPVQTETSQSPIGINSLLDWPSNVLHPLFK